jgi:hypothetical protein
MITETTTVPAQRKVEHDVDGGRQPLPRGV